MRILWIVNVIFPEPCKVLGYPEPTSGGWMYESAKQVSKIIGIELSVAAIYPGTIFRKLSIDGICYYLLPCKNSLTYQKSLELKWKEVCSNFKPDLVHIHGTEFSHGLACINSNPSLKYVISIQGLVSLISRYYLSDISYYSIIRNLTFRDLFRFDSIFNQMYKFKKRGELEVEYLLKVKNVIGRTAWDKIHTLNINSDIQYHFCNESLRKEFYSATNWSIDKCCFYTIFISQGAYPIKGLHKIIMALFILKKDFPNVKLRIAGRNILKKSSLIDLVKYSGYAKYISSLIQEFDLWDNVTFLGELSVNEMIKEYQKANVFVCSSSIENSSNSVGEAQIIGTPVVASNVGGIPDMVNHGVNGFLYPFQEFEILSFYIKLLFLDPKKSSILSKQSIIDANLRHDSSLNLNSLLNIYNSIIL